MATKTLRVTLAEILGPAGPSGRVHGEVWAQYVDGNGAPREIRYTDGTIVVMATPRLAPDELGIVDFPVVPSDDPTVHEDDQGFGVRIGWDLTERGPRGSRRPVPGAGKVVNIVTADAEVVQFGAKADYVPVIAGSTYLTEAAGDTRYAAFGATASWANITDRPTLGTAAATDAGDYATAAQGAAVGVVLAGAGIDPTGATDSTTAIQAKLDSLPATGGRAHFPAGRFKVAGLTITRPTTLTGAGGMFVAANQGGTYPGSAITTLVVDSTTANGITVSAPGCTFLDLAIVNISVTDPTAGTGLALNSCNNFKLNRVTVAGFYNCVQVEGRFGAIDSCHIYDPVNYGLYMLNNNAGESDFGDQGVSNTVIAMYGRHTTAAAACRWESGGGIRWTGNKIVAGTGPGASSIGTFAYGLDIMAANGVSTVEWMVSGGGISTCSTACVRLGQVGTGQIGDVTFHGVVMQGAGTTANAMLIGAADTNHANNIKLVTVSGCTFKGVASGGIIAYNLKGLVIGTNTWGSAAYTGPLITLAGGNDDGTGTRDVHVAKQNLAASPFGVDVVRDNRRLSGTAHTLTGVIDHGFTSNMYTNVVDTWVTAGYVDLVSNDGGAVMLDIKLTGYDYGVGPVYARYRRVVSKTGPSGTLTVTTIGVDETAGAGTHYAIQIATGTANRGLIQYKLTTAGVTLWGRVSVVAEGSVALFHVGP